MRPAGVTAIAVMVGVTLPPPELELLLELDELLELEPLEELELLLELVDPPELDVLPELVLEPLLELLVEVPLELLLVLVPDELELVPVSLLPPPPQAARVSMTAIALSAVSALKLAIGVRNRVGKAGGITQSFLHDGAHAGSDGAAAPYEGSVTCVT